MNSRLKNLVTRLIEHRLDAYIVTCEVNATYLTRFPASESWLLVLPNKAYYITDFRYVLEARAGLKGVTVKQYTESIFTTLFETLQKAGAKTVGFDARHLSLSVYAQMRQHCPSGIKLVVKNGLVEGLRVIKDKAEIGLVRKALKLHHAAYRYLSRVVRPGKTEAQVLRLLENYVKARQAGFSFDPIIASGPNSCLPHAKVSDRRIRNNEPVLIDMGIDIQGYKSDLTRMFFLGKIAPRVAQVVDAVRIAQSRAIEGIRDGVEAARVDSLARNYLKQKGLAKYFGHSLGHGVGLEIHEAPSLSQKSPTVLKAGMIVTVEPAVYIPYKFGVRIEDMVLVTKKGCEVLSRPNA